MCSFIRSRMSLVIVISNTLLLQGARERELYSRQRPDLVNGAVMELLVPWKVYVSQRLGSQRLEIRAAGGQME